MLAKICLRLLAAVAIVFTAACLTPRAREAESFDWTGTWRGTWTTTTGESADSTLVISGNGQASAGNWDGYPIENLRMARGSDGSAPLLVTWQHHKQGLLYQVSAVVVDHNNIRVFFDVVDPSGHKLDEGQGFFKR